MYAPDLVEVKRKDGAQKEYYLYPHSRGQDEKQSSRKKVAQTTLYPRQPNADGTKTLPGSILDRPSVYIEYITDPNDPDYEIGFRAYGYWGFQRSLAAQLDQNTMYSVRPGTEVIPYSYQQQLASEIADPKNIWYSAYVSGEDLEAFNFFEASSIRKIGNKYCLMFCISLTLGINNMPSLLTLSF